MKTRWLRIAVYNIKLSSYGRKDTQKKKYIHCWRKWQGSIWGILGFWYPSNTASDMTLSRGYGLQHITHIQLTGDLRCGFSLCYTHTGDVQVQTPQSFSATFMISELKSWTRQYSESRDLPIAPENALVLYFNEEKIFFIASGSRSASK